MPTARTHDQHCSARIELVLFVALVKHDRALDCIAQIDLAFEHVGPRRAIGILEVRHESGGPAVERVDDHLAIGGSGDLDTAIEQIGGLRCDDPICAADGLGPHDEAREFAGGELPLSNAAMRQQLLAARLELAVQCGKKGQRSGAQNSREFSAHTTNNLDISRHRQVHRSSLL